MGIVLTVLESIFLASALSIDAFVASVAYGSENIKIPMLSVQVVNLICSLMLGGSLLAGSWVRQFIPTWLTTFICFLLLLILGLVKLLDSFTKSLIRRYSSHHRQLSRQIHFKLFHLRFVLSLYADPEEADRDHSKVISPAEATSLALALSLDGMAVGFGAALGQINPWAVLFCSLATNMLAILLGVFVGRKAAQKLPFNVSWAGGAILIVLAFCKLF